MSKSIFSIFLLFLPCFLMAQDQDATPLQIAPQVVSSHQLRIGVDASKLLINQLVDNKKTFEFAIDYYYKKELYWVAEFGTGSSTINYPDLQYGSNNGFLRAGIDKSLFNRKNSQDWGLGFFGFRYGLGFVNRGTAQYSTNDGYGSITTGVLPAKNFTTHWMELVGGMKIELINGFFAGWTVRAKFLINPKAMGDLKPYLIAGYGAGEKSTAFDYNFYLSYAVRWKTIRKNHIGQ